MRFPESLRGAAQFPRKNFALPPITSTAYASLLFDSIRLSGAPRAAALSREVQRGHSAHLGRATSYESRQASLSRYAFVHGIEQPVDTICF